MRRFIPAGAGNAWWLRPPAPPHPVHPRGCGERAAKALEYQRAGGSSPRVRGTLRCTQSRTLHGRFIPAGAGNATWSSDRSRPAAVHPRGCGERAGGAGLEGRADGSSPRVRGTHARAGLDARAGRFIPAGAGNAVRNSASPAAPAVHPRGCGERLFRASFIRPATGSSPRVRGTQRRDTLRAARRRFIPAGAGNAARIARGARITTVHPRGCGERAGGVVLMVAYSGSSPRVRGTLQAAGQHLDLGRFIPAGAGNARPPSPRGCSWPVHPRGCGERETEVPSDQRLDGSSPRVRGPRRVHARSAQGQRFIPAGAGNAMLGRP